ncbi:AT-hook DNA-binding motif-containing protein 1 [Mastacembelus armatus]|uniref:AT-hook DNA-binding motif-containing protein 1 n=1 Tax=Mastacembelus armatus TaxID=205130 RepID=UPI000E453DCC|nr:AT-hook DNA-binding motif-containing protein 1 [Mastacembelus armatus]XP_026156633.1 AT-hook DNA-binding motif-containing protein 1 [Mastacembelus armatus]XP_026156634.1 AT-hook DNA-binding motif-containing protein 1 [Mastacembelus armatus]
MSGLSDHLLSGQTGAPVGCGGNQTEEKGCVGELEELEGPEFWTRELRLQEGSQDSSNDGLAPVTSDHFAPSSSAALANGLHLQRRLGHSTCRRRLTETHTTTETLTFAETLRNMQTHIDPDVHAQAVSHAHMDNCGQMEVNAHTGSVRPEHPRTLTPEAIHTTSPQPLSLALGNHPASTNQLTAPVLTAETDMPSTFCPVPVSPNSNTGSSSFPVEAEKKYALRSSGRPRFPCHLRKSSRLRRSIEDGEKRTVREREGEEDDEVLEEKIWRVKEEEVATGQKEENLSVEAVLPTPPCPADVALALTVSKPVPKAIPKPGPRLGHRPGPKSRCRPAPKSVHKAGPKSVMKQRQASQSFPHRVTPHLPFVNTSTIPAPVLTVKEEPGVDLGVCPPSNQRRGRFVGVRKIVVKVARIPISLSRRQKSYKISNLETVTGTEKGNDGGLEGSEAVREPTALLRMKNNGKSVMVMFPPGELPVILKRRRGRPPKQALPGIPGEPLNAGNPGSNGEQPKKPRRRRRTKLPCPYPSYVNDTNDVKTEYGDVLSKLAFLNRQPPATGRCSPPRCWTPSEPESFHAPLENPGISTLLHRLTGFRRPRGGRGGGIGRGGAAGGVGGTERNKSTFSDFFESIGKKRKLSPLSEHGLPRKRGKGVGGGGVGRGGGIVGTEPGGEKIVRKRRTRKNGAFKGEGGSMGQDWPNGAGGWGEEGSINKEKGLGGFQFCGTQRGGFSSCEVARGGTFSGPGGRGGVGPAGEDSQGLFAGYFRSLLDSDDSSDLLDISSSQSDPRKASSTPGYEPSSPAGQSWSAAFSKWSSKGAGSGAEGSAQTHCSSARPPYSYSSLAQTSPTTSTYPKSTPPSLSHSPSSPHPTSYGHYTSGYSSSSPAASQRSSDCSFAYGAGNSSGKSIPVGQIGYSNYQAAAKRGYSGFSATGLSSMVRGESVGSTSPGGGYMSVAKGSPFSSSSPEGFKLYNSNQWSYRQGYGSWSSDSFGSQYHCYSEYGSNESKDILDISNYTPQKAKRQPFLESLSESSSDSSHLGSAATGSGPTSTGGTYRQNEPASVSGEGAQSSLSSLEKLMMDWHESASGPSYNWSQNVLFQGGGTSKPGRGRRKRTEQLSEKEGGSCLHSDSPSSPSPTPTPGPKRGGIGGRGRGSRGGRGGLSPCQRERPSGAKGRGKAASTSTAGGVVTAGVPEGSGLFQEGLDYYSGDSSSLSPLATPNPAPPSSYLPEPCEYPSPYSAHPSTPSSEERYPALYPGESSSSLSPSVSSPPYPPKPTPPPPQSYHPIPSRTFSPSCSPSPRVTPHCGTALSPSHRPPPKDPQFSQYDSPSYCSSPYWYGQTSHSGSPSPHSHSTHSNTAVHTHSNPHTSPHRNTHGSTLSNPNANTHAHMTSTPHDAHHHSTQPHANLSSHTNTHPTSHLQSNPLSHSNPHTSNQPHHNAQTNPSTHLASHTHSNPSPSLHSHSAPVLYEERSPPSTMTPHKRDMTTHTMSIGHRQSHLPHSPYPKPALDSSPHQEETSSYSLSHQSYQGVGHRYPSQAVQGSGVLCQLLDPANDDSSFSVTSL